MSRPDPQRNKIKLADPCVSEAEERAVVEVLRSGRLVAGPRVEEMERRLAELTGRKHAVAVSSGTAALLAAMEALGVGSDSVVVVPALTFPSPAVVAAFLGARVRLCDVEPDTLNLSARTLAAAMGDDVTHVVAIDQFGVPAPMPEIERVAGDVPVIVDAACSLGAALDRRPCGSFGRAATVSFHPRKIVTTGEGGAVLTDDGALAAAVRRFRNIGMGPTGFESIGLNLRPSEMGAAIGLCQLDRLDDIIHRRDELAGRYRSLPIGFQRPPEGGSPNNQTLAAVLPDGEDRDGLIRHLADNGVEAQVASYCIARLPWLAVRLGVDPASVPVASTVHDLGVALPLHEGLEVEEVDLCASLVHDWLDERGLGG